MAVPLQYQSQFIPTDFGTLGSILGMYRQDMQQRNQEFDQGIAMRDAAIANIYGMDTLDPEVFQQRGDIISKQIEEAITKRGGDPGAAAADISKIIAQENRNPIYGLNKRKLEQVSQLEQALARNHNLLTLQDPRQIALTQKGLTPEDIAYSVLDPEEIRKMAKQDLAYLDKKRLSGIRTTPEGYDVASYASGPSDKEVQSLMQDPNIVANLRSYFPQLKEGQFNDVLSSIVESTARSYQRAPEETVLGFNPRVRQSLEELKDNPYGALIPTAPVGMEGIKNIFPVEKAKEFWNMPNDNSILGILHKDIKNDILYNQEKDTKGELLPSFAEQNKTLLDEFGTIDNAKNLIDNYSIPNDNTLQHPKVLEYLSEHPDYLKRPENMGYNSYAAIGRLYKDLVEQGKIDPTQNSKDREEFNRATKLVDNFEIKLNERLFKENSDMMKSFEHYDIFTGYDKLDKATEQSMKRFQDFTTNQLNLTDFTFESTSNKDIDFSDQQELIDDKDKNYKKAQEGGYKITGIAVDPLLGIKLKVETENDEGGTTTHIASPSSPAIEQQLIKAYSGGNRNTDSYKTYEKFFYNRLGNNLLQNMEQVPELSPTPGITVGEYKKELQQKANSGLIDENQARAIIHYLIDSGTNNNVKL